MSDFNLHKYFKNQYLEENDDPKMGAELEAGLGGTGVAEGVDIYSALNSSIPENTSYSDFAKAVARMLKEEYGSHNVAPFMEVLHSELGINESLNEGEEEQLADEFRNKFDVRVSSMMWGNEGKIEILIRSDISDFEFEEMIQWVEDKGYKVNRNQSGNQFDYDDDRYWYPRIIFSK
jgi:hypothetical protein